MLYPYLHLTDAINSMRRANPSSAIGFPGSGWVFVSFLIAGVSLATGAVTAYFVPPIESFDIPPGCAQCQAPPTPALVWTSAELAMLYTGAALALTGGLLLGSSLGFRRGRSEDLHPLSLARAWAGFIGGGANLVWGVGLFTYVQVNAAQLWYPHSSYTPITIGSFAQIALAAVLLGLGANSSRVRSTVRAPT